MYKRQVHTVRRDGFVIEGGPDSAIIEKHWPITMARRLGLGDRFEDSNEGIRKSFEGSSLETIKHMVAAGMGVTLVPRLSVPKEALGTQVKRKKSEETYVRYLPIADEAGGQPPTRRVVLAWRRSFTRYEAIAALRNAIYSCELPGVQRLS